MNTQNTYLASKPHYEILDGLRGVAALIVVAFHLFETHSDGDHIAQIINHGEWHKKLDKIVWDKEILGVIQHIAKRTPRSKIEIKDTALVWHYRDVDSWLADLRVTQLINALINPSSRHNLQIMKGNKIVEVKNNNVTKGSEALRLLGKEQYDFIMAVGDDTTDEDMFMIPTRNSLPNTSCRDSSRDCTLHPALIRGRHFPANR